MEIKPGQVERGTIMLQSKRLSRFMIVLAVVIAMAFLLETLKKIDLNDQAVTAVNGEKDKGYNITFISTTATEELPWRDELSFNIIQLEGMKDALIQQNVNRIMKEAATSWMKGIAAEASLVHCDIYAHSSQYLSFRNRFAYSGVSHSNNVSDYITIDIKNGKRVMLSDLVEINADFVEYIQNNNLVKGCGRPLSYAFDNKQENLWEYLQEMSPDELLEKLEGCSKTQEEILEGADIDNYTSIGSLVLRDSFYLRSGRLVIVIGDKKTIKSSRDRKDAVDSIHLTFELDDIADFLKVEPWY